MKTYKQILTEFSSHYSSDERSHYLKTLTLEELKLFKNNVIISASSKAYPLICEMIDHILIEKLQEDRENKLKELLK
jgi:hypothetical protein